MSKEYETRTQQMPVGEVRQMSGNLWADSKNYLFTKSMNGEFFPVPTARKRSKFWSIVHNLIAHPLLITGTRWADRFHDWTADKM